MLTVIFHRLTLAVFVCRNAIMKRRFLLGRFIGCAVLAGAMAPARLAAAPCHPDYIGGEYGSVGYRFHWETWLRSRPAIDIDLNYQFGAMFQNQEVDRCG
jgi:hypothetical protein